MLRNVRFRSYKYGILWDIIEFPKKVGSITQISILSHLANYWSNHNQSNNIHIYIYIIMNKLNKQIPLEFENLPPILFSLLKTR